MQPSARRQIEPFADGALAMAWTVIDLASDAHLRERLAAKAYRHPSTGTPGTS